MKRRNVVLGDDLDDPYLKGRPDCGPGAATVVIVILVVLGIWAGII